MTIGVTPLRALNDFFRLQDTVVEKTLQTAAGDFGLISRGLALAFDLTVAFNDHDTVALRKTKAPDAVKAETVVANLLHASFSSLVNATRLALFGAHVNALALVRDAFEAAYHSEYFRLHPEAVERWDAAATIPDLDERRKYLEKNFPNIRRTLEERDDPGRTRTALYRELCSYGAHINPATVGLRISVPTPAEVGMANIGFTSVGKREATTICALHTLHVLMYGISEFFDAFGTYPSVTRYNSAYLVFRSEWESHRADAPSSLSLMR